MDQVLTNLLVNARDAIDGGGTIEVGLEVDRIEPGAEVGHPEAEPGEWVVLRVADTGRGIRTSELEHIFEPFYTTKPVGEGTGLGLATTYGIVRQNGGFIDLETAPGEGAAFHVHLPRSREEPRRRSARVAPPPVSRGETILVVEDEAAVLRLPVKAREPAAAGPGSGRGETVLVVEDQPAVLSLAERILTRSGYRVLTADGPAAALELAREHAAEVDLLLTDVVMPDMNGRELAERIEGENPGLRILYMSGYAEDVVTHHGAPEEGVDFIAKPFTAKQLVRRVREALDHSIR